MKLSASMVCLALIGCSSEKSDTCAPKKRAARDAITVAMPEAARVRDEWKAELATIGTSDGDDQRDVVTRQLTVAEGRVSALVGWADSVRDGKRALITVDAHDRIVDFARARDAVEIYNDACFPVRGAVR